MSVCVCLCLRSGEALVRRVGSLAALGRASVAAAAVAAEAGVGAGGLGLVVVGDWVVCEGD